MPPRLEDVLAYENDDIPGRMLDEWEIELADARELFDDVKRFMYLSEVAGIQTVIYGPLMMLDEAWHNFILFTAEYTAYSLAHYGHYVHHAPATQTEYARIARELAAQPEATRRGFLETNARQRAAVIEHLGVDTLLRWYVDYPQRYSDEFFARHRRPLRSAWKADPELLALAAEVRGAPA